MTSGKKWRIYLKQFSSGSPTRRSNGRKHTFSLSLSPTYKHTYTHIHEHTPTNAIGENAMLCMSQYRITIRLYRLWHIFAKGSPPRLLTPLEIVAICIVRPHCIYRGRAYSPEGSSEHIMYLPYVIDLNPRPWIWMSRTWRFAWKLAGEDTLSTCMCVCTKISASNNRTFREGRTDGRTDARTNERMDTLPAGIHRSTP